MNGKASDFFQILWPFQKTSTLLRYTLYIFVQLVGLTFSQCQERSRHSGDEVMTQKQDGKTSSISSRLGLSCLMNSVMGPFFNKLDHVDMKLKLRFLI